MERLILWSGRLLLFAITSAMAFAVVGVAHSEMSGGRGYVLSELRDRGVLTEGAANLWCHAGEDSSRTDGFATFIVPAEELTELDHRAVRWLGYGCLSADAETRSIIERCARRFRLPATCAPLPDWESEELIVYHDPGFWLWGDVLILSRERQRVWYFRFVPEE